MVTQEGPTEIEWVLLSYRLPREPSTPRIAVWRKLKRLGAEQIGDGLVALPEDARTREHLEWVAADVVAADGEAAVWVARTARSTSESIAYSMRTARDAEYRALLDSVTELSAPVDTRTLKRLRRSYRTIERRDHFRAELRDRARLAIDALADADARTRATS